MLLSAPRSGTLAAEHWRSSRDPRDETYDEEAQGNKTSQSQSQSDVDALLRLAVCTVIGFLVFRIGLVYVVLPQLQSARREMHLREKQGLSSPEEVNPPAKHGAIPNAKGHSTRPSGVLND